MRSMKKLVLCTLSLTIFATWARAQVPGMAPPAAAQTSGQLADTSALAREATGWLTDLIKINTTNPPGNEEAAAKYLAGILQKEGIKAELLPLEPGRSALVARLTSSAFPDPSKALLLVAHMDVVGVERAKWTVDPFGAVTKDGYIYGRGAVDDKGMLAANLAAFIALKRANARLNRDVIFLATDDEEGAGDASIRMLIAKYWDKIAAKYSINEGGNVFVKNGKVQYVAVQASEKVSVNVTVRANVIPSEARATLNVRLLPGNTITVLLAELNKLVNDPQVKLEVQPDGGLAAPDSSLESEFYAAIVKASAEEFGGVPVLPFQSTWATDSAQLRLHNVQAYGLVPFPLTDDDIKRMHGDDERIPAAAFAKGVNLMVRLANEFAVSH